jgi:hypothetical protein
MNFRLPATLALLAAAATAEGEPLGDDLCAFAVEGLTLESMQSEAAAVFAKRGWHDLSNPRSVQANGVVVERIEFDRTRTSDSPEEVKADKDGPIGRFQLVRDAGGGRSLRLSDYADSPPADRARALCASAAGRFEVSGCDERFLARDQFGVIIRPLNVAPGAESCTVSFDGAKTSFGQTYTLSVTQGARAGRGQPGRTRGRQQGAEPDGR